MKEKLNIIIVDDDRSSTWCLRMKLKKMKQAARVDLADSAAELLEKYLPARHYDIIYLDQFMPEKYGTEVAGIIKKEYPLMKIIFHTATNDLTEADKIFKTKPAGWLWKDFICRDAELSVETILTGRHFYSKEVDDIHDELDDSKDAAAISVDDSEKLSAREKEVYKLYCKGYSEKEIADIISRDIRTVESHMRKIHSKTKKKERAELVTHAMNIGLIPKF
ncbi:MAG TPA: response regulator transcription factor [Bacteroidia bacterium]|nr:response regulator transcription factor [Bacteroidia bacterium]